MQADKSSAREDIITTLNLSRGKKVAAGCLSLSLSHSLAPTCCPSGHLSSFGRPSVTSECTFISKSEVDTTILLHITESHLMCTAWTMRWLDLPAAFWPRAGPGGKYTSCHNVKRSWIAHCETETDSASCVRASPAVFSWCRAVANDSCWRPQHWNGPSSCCSAIHGRSSTRKGARTILRTRLELDAI